MSIKMLAQWKFLHFATSIHRPVYFKYLVLKKTRLTRPVKRQSKLHVFATRSRLGTYVENIANQIGYVAYIAVQIRYVATIRTQNEYVATLCGRSNLRDFARAKTVMLQFYATDNGVLRPLRLKMVILPFCATETFERFCPIRKLQICAFQKRYIATLTCSVLMFRPTQI